MGQWSVVAVIFFLMRVFRDSGAQSVVLQNLGVTLWHRMEKMDVSKHCFGTFGIGVMEDSLETMLLHGHWHSQGGCGEKLLGGSSKHLWRQLVQERENMAVLCGGYC